jgi:hyaluronan synthase
MMAKYVFKNFRNGAKFGTRLLFLNQSLKIIMAIPFLLLMVFLILTHPILVISSTLLGILIFSSFPALFYARRYSVLESFWAYTYSVFYTFSLFWILPYAIFTANKSGWLTRGLSQQE